MMTVLWLDISLVRNTLLCCEAFFQSLGRSGSFPAHTVGGFSTLPLALLWFQKQTEPYPLFETWL